MTITITMDDVLTVLKYTVIFFAGAGTSGLLIAFVIGKSAKHYW